MRTIRQQAPRKAVALAAVASLTFFAAACGSEDDEADDTGSGDTTSEPSEDESMSEDMPSEDESMDPAAMLVGSGCEAYAEANPDGAGSVGGMAQDPVGTAATNNPLLKTLTQAVSGQLNPDVDLVGTLNDPEAEYTVFAPVDDAFAKLPQETVQTLGTPAGAETLSTVLTYHVLPERVDPADLSGSYATVAGPELEVSGSGDNLKVNGNASVICGGVQTANATVYLIDTVLMPPNM